MDDLRGLGYTDRDIMLLVAMTKQKETVKAEGSAKAKTLTTSQLMVAYGKKLIGDVELSAKLHTLGYSDDDIKILVGATSSIQNEVTKT